MFVEVAVVLLQKLTDTDGVDDVVGLRHALEFPVLSPSLLSVSFILNSADCVSCVFLVLKFRRPVIGHCKSEHLCSMYKLPACRSRSSLWHLNTKFALLIPFLKIKMKTTTALGSTRCGWPLM
jgi:hypothetical protein